ncbi:MULTISPECIES: hypothetical protein [Holospora]|uniref:Uncharacterized protein n=2 Tax=Holospora TaxID=44747 RepID=A0A061JIS1_9PROT|nr:MULTISPECIES: hypothetical protein [Holospora]ETZ05054.1 hypothetical protein K737_300523 [Holospora undulata HU1]GAJ46338.1 hypothetical protein HE1_00670 [Holospora elegans E1]
MSADKTKKVPFHRLIKKNIILRCYSCNGVRFCKSFLKDKILEKEHLETQVLKMFR